MGRENREGRTATSPQSEGRYRRRLVGFRVLAIVTLALGVQYIVWRYAATLNLNALWFAIPLVLAETYSLIGVALLILNVWQPARRVAPPPLEGATVDVYLTLYDEPVELFRLTAEAATRIRWPELQVYILDDGARPAVAALAQELGCGYLTRGDEWTGKPRHAKAGNINNALLETSGQYILVLDCDQIPDPRIVERCIGYFSDPKVAFVQTPQYFYNVPPGDPLGADAALFYGPIQQGKDGWDAAFFCGSNALLRREALMQIGLTDYAREMEARMERRLHGLERSVTRARAAARTPAAAPTRRAALASLKQALGRARQAMQAGQPLETVSDMVRRAVADAQRTVQQDAAQGDLAAIAGDLREMDGHAAQVGDQLLEHLPEVAGAVAENTPSSPEALGLPLAAADGLDLTREDEAIPIMGLPTFSVTEDMAVAMRLHATGWRSVYHPEILAYGLAPEDLGAALQQRLRWAQGTIQVLLHENPLFVPGLSLPQRLQYFTTMYSYFSGFASLIYLLAPIVYLFTGISPISSLPGEFLWRLVPYLVVNRVTMRYIAWGLSILRGEQYSVGLFSLWIQAVVSVLFGVKPAFKVTAKQRRSGKYVKLVWPQLLIVCATVLAILYGSVVLALGWPRSLGATLVSAFWGGYNILMLSAILRAAVYRPPSVWQARPPAFLFPDQDL